MSSPLNLISLFCGLLVIVVAVLGGMIAFGTRTPPVPLASIGKPFESVDFRDLPEVEMISSRTGRQIAFRRWGNDLHTPASQPIVVAIHGSSASSSSFHPLAKALAADGMLIYAPDLRGHGDTGRRGDIDYPQQLDDDLADLVAVVQARHPSGKLVLMGFSSGGGFALHVAASPLGKAFERTVLLSPMLGIRAPTSRPEGRAWATAFVPRILAIKLLNEIGIHLFDHLNVLAFAIDPEQSKILTSYYSFLLMNAFATADYAADLRRVSSPMAVLVGEQDELFDSGLFAPTIGAIRTDIPVTVVPGMNHIAMIVDPHAVPAISEAIRGIR
jgi:non-heme chloroperoxidase